MATLSDDTPRTPDSYADAAADLDKRLDEALMLIRRASDNGDLTALEAADRCIGIMANHLNSVGLLRERYFGDAAAPAGDGGWNSGTCSTK